MVAVVGVVPEEFHGPYSIVELDAYAPIGRYGMASGNPNFFTDRRDTELRVLATLKPGVTPMRAETTLNVIAKRLAKEYPQIDQGQVARVIPERLARPEPSVEHYMPLVTTIFLAMVGLVLLVACFNVANLLLVRAAAREREIAVRAAMGASRARLVRQMLTESVLLAMVGAVGGACVGYWVAGGWRDCARRATSPCISPSPLTGGCSVMWRRLQWSLELQPDWRQHYASPPLTSTTFCAKAGAP
jgi:hypothetical protein